MVATDDLAGELGHTVLWRPDPVDPLFWDRRFEELLSVPPRRAPRIPVRLFSRPLPRAEVEAYLEGR